MRLSDTGGTAARRVASQVRDRILSGGLGEGDQLPTASALAAEFGVSRATAGRVLELLQAEGLVVARPGAGTFVRAFKPIQRSNPKRLARNRWGAGLAIQDDDTEGRWRTVNVKTGEGAPPKWAAEALGLGEGAAAAFRSREFQVDGRAVQLSTSWLPVDLARGTPIMHTDSGPGGIYRRLLEIGHAPTLFTEHLRARMPLPDETERLHLTDGTPVFEITRRALEKGGRCVEVNRMVLDGGVYLLDYTFPADVRKSAERG